MAIKFFGDFLVTRGKISTEQLDQTAQYQAQNNVSLGELAVLEEYLDNDQVTEINKQQHIYDQKFGEIAVKLNLLNSNQITSLLHAQKERNIFFGDALVQNGFLSQEELDIELERFNDLQNDSSKHSYTEVAFCDRDRIMQKSIIMFENLYHRICREHIKFQTIDLSEPTNRDVPFLSQNISGEESIGYAILNDSMKELPQFLDIFLRHIATYLKSKGLVINYDNYHTLDNESFNFENYFGLKFISTKNDILLYIKI